jgi:hypothetical protein
VALRRIGVEERRTRLAWRHHLCAEAPAPDVTGAAEGLVGLHATDPATVFLSAWARVPGLKVGDVEGALYEQRSLVRHLCMRRTLFVLPTHLVPVVQAACTNRIAQDQRKRLLREIEAAGIAADGTTWLAALDEAVTAVLAQVGEATGAQLSKAVPGLQAKLTYAEGKAYGGPMGVATRVFTVLAAEGRIVRGRPTGTWTSSAWRWALLPGGWPSLSPADATAELARRWLVAFGPAPVADLKWWTGLTMAQVRAALASLDVVDVDLDGRAGVMLADDEGPVDAPAPWAALLPALDATTMGWQERDWYLGAHAKTLFDTNGNAGPTVWWDGRVVGGWGQRVGGEVVVRLLEDVGSDAKTAIDAETDRLQAWLGTTVVTPRFPSPLSKEIARS